MSVVEELLTKLDEKIKAILLDYKPLPYVYNIELNDRLADKNFGILVGSASSIEGANRALTYDHNFEVVLSQRWIPKRGGAGDKDLRDKISLIMGDHEKIAKEVYRRPLALDSANLLIISPLELSAPEVDNDNNIVNVTLTLSIKYRVAT
jgi:hypothetical protein